MTDEELRPAVDAFWAELKRQNNDSGEAVWLGYVDPNYGTIDGHFDGEAVVRAVLVAAALARRPPEGIG